LVTGDFEELTGEELQNLGNWNVDTMEDLYSFKIPFPALQVMAGHPKEKGLYFVPRGDVTPPKELSVQVILFLESSLETLSLSSSVRAHVRNCT
jgi:hypothetical protein